MRKEIKDTLDYAERIASYNKDKWLTSTHVIIASFGSTNLTLKEVYTKFKVCPLKVTQAYFRLSQKEKDNSDELFHVVKTIGSTTTLPILISELLKSDTEVRRLLEAMEIDTALLSKALARRVIAITQTKKKLTNINKYCKDLAALAEIGELDPVIGRGDEIDRIVQILGRRRKNNPAILGPAGVGKSALVEGLALSIHNKEKRSKKLHGKRLIILDLSLMLAGTKYRGMFEERLTGVIEELEDNPNIIVFIDELHMLVGSGSCEGSQDAANMLKPALARGKIQVIGATTIKEYKSIKADAALARRFQPVVLKDLTDGEVLDILKGVKHLYEDHHKVTYTLSALEKIVELGKLVEGRHSPDVQIDLMDEVGSSSKRKRICAPDIVQIFGVQQEANQSKKKTMGFGA